MFEEENGQVYVQNEWAHFVFFIELRIMALKI